MIAETDIWAGIESVTLRKGCGTGLEGDACAIQEARRRNGLNPAVDHCPGTMCPVVYAMIIIANDASQEGRKAVLHLLPKAWNSRQDAAGTVRRAMRIATEAMRLLPAALEAAGLKAEADKFRDYPDIHDEAAARAAGAAAWAAAGGAGEAAETATWAARAAGAAAGAAAGDVAWAVWGAGAAIQTQFYIRMLEEFLAEGITQ